MRIKQIMKSHFLIIISMISCAYAEDLKKTPIKLGDEDWRYYQLDNQTKLKLEEEITESNAKSESEIWTKRLLYFPESGKATLIWEDRLKSPPVVRTSSPRIAVARKFGDVFCVALRNAFEQKSLDILRVDTAKTPYATVILQASTPEDGFEYTDVIIEGPNNFCYTGKDGKKNTFRVFEDGRLELNSIPYPTIARVNGKVVVTLATADPNPVTNENPTSRTSHGGGNRDDMRDIAQLGVVSASGDKKHRINSDNLWTFFVVAGSFLVALVTLLGFRLWRNRRPSGK